MEQHRDTPKDVALLAVGRTVVNFQKLEHALKLAAQFGSLNGTIQKIERDSAKRRERAGTFMLGQAIRAWLENWHDLPAQRDDTPDLFDVTFQTTYFLEIDDESRSRHAKALGDLLEVRNDLVHSRLAKFEWESPQACEHLVVELNGVNAEISEQLQYVNSILKTFAELSKDHREALESMRVANGLRDT